MHTVAAIQPAEQGEEAVRSVGILSTFPPTSCGIATFSAALAAGLIADGASVDVVRCGASPQVEDALVLAALDDDPASRSAVVDVLNDTDVVIVQHEYGLYDGPDGDSLLTLIAAVDTPTVVVAHTVVTSPTANQRFVLEQVCAEAEAVVVMTDTARTRLCTGFDVDPVKVLVIPHGAATPAANPVIERHRAGAPPRLLTWGLLGPGKGIEWAIDAMALLEDVDPRPEYLVAGATHPKVREHSGEAYREMLVARAAASASSAACPLRRHVPRPRLADRTDRFGGPGRPAVRLPGSGHVGGAGRRRGGRTARGVDRVPSRRRTALQRRRLRRPPTGPGRARNRHPIDPHHTGSPDIDGDRSPPTGTGARLVGRRASLHPPREPTSGAATSARHDLAVVRSCAVDERPHRHVRTRRPQRTATRSWLLHRRPGQVADRHHPQSRSLAGGSRPRSDGVPLPHVRAERIRPDPEPAHRQRTVAGATRGRRLLGTQPLGVRNGRRSGPSRS